MTKANITYLSQTRKSSLSLIYNNDPKMIYMDHTVRKAGREMVLYSISPNRLVID